MATVIKAIYEDGVFKPEEPVSLAEKARVQLVIEPALAVVDEESSRSWEAWQGIIGIANDEGGPTDVAENHDHYLYGLPRR